MTAHKKDYLLVKINSGTDDRLVGVTDEDRNWILSLEDGEFAKCTINDTRSLWRHRKFFLLLNKVQQHLPDYLTESDMVQGFVKPMSRRYPTAESILIALKLELKLYDVVYSVNGDQFKVVKGSISFASMGEARFKEFVNQCRDLILQFFLTDVDPGTFDKEFMSLMFN